jgi:flagellar biosynthesis chaperone FliJ
MKRLLALRLIEEEREEVELRRQRQLRQACLEALEANEAGRAMALHALHAALESGDRTQAMSAEMALACGPMERRIFQHHLSRLDEIVAKATATLQASRTRRLQMEALFEAAQTREHRKMLTREQKMMDRWFLSSRPQGLRTPADESFQREQLVPAEGAGTTRANNAHG